MIIANEQKQVYNQRIYASCREGGIQDTGMTSWPTRADCIEPRLRLQRAPTLFENTQLWYVAGLGIKTEILKMYTNDYC